LSPLSISFITGKRAIEEKRRQVAALQIRTPTTSLLSGIVLIVVLIVASASCRHRSEPAQRYELKGKVVNVDKRGAVVTISHEDIRGYMDAMTMPFALKDPSLLDVMNEGDGVQATLVVSGARSWLEDVIVTRQTVDPSNVNSANSSEPKPGDEVPDFALVNQDGKRISLREYRGRAVALTFIYTRCPLPDYCPLMTEHFGEIEKALAAEPEMYAKTHLLSITVDPEFDVPRVLRNYAVESAGRPSFSHWEFATGTSDQVKQIATYFGLQYFKENDQIIHSLRTAVIAPDGKLVDFYHGNLWKPLDIIRELRASIIAADAQHATGTLGDTKETVSSRVFKGVGVVEEIDQDAGTVQIDHEDIDGLMSAMSMPFKVKDKSILDAVARGDKVSFEISGGLVVVSITKL
jgi:protein SCO1